jgi:phosphoserine phosphatase
MALLDWDGTLRRGFTVVKWAQTLADAGLITRRGLIKMRRLFRSFRVGELSHDRLARETARLYSTELSGQSKSEVERLARKFVRSDRSQLFKWTPQLLRRLVGRRIVTVVVSGVPQELLREYEERYHLDAIYGLMLETRGPTFTGRVAWNPGVSAEKRRIVREIKRAHKGSAILAMGNSASDLPLLRAARFRVVVDNGKLSPGPRTIHISGRNDPMRVVQVIDKTIGPW